MQKALLALFLTLGLIGCSGNSASNSDSQTSTPPPSSAEPQMQSGPWVVQFSKDTCGYEADADFTITGNQIAASNLLWFNGSTPAPVQCSTTGAPGLTNGTPGTSSISGTISGATVTLTVTENGQPFETDQETLSADGKSLSGNASGMATSLFQAQTFSDTINFYNTSGSPVWVNQTTSLSLGAVGSNATVTGQLTVSNGQDLSGTYSLTGSQVGSGLILTTQSLGGAPATFVGYLSNGTLYLSQVIQTSNTYWEGFCGSLKAQ